MSLTLEDFKNRFKKLGKLIYLAQNAPALAVELKKIHVAAIDQLASTYAGVADDSEEFDLLDEAISPLGQQVKAATDAITSLPSSARTAADVILRRYIAVDIGQQSGAGYTTLGPALANAMGAVGASVAPAAGNPNGFAAWFNAQFGIALPTNASASIPDAWVTDAVV